ncbi:MAG TPA: flagellar basal body-associated FliL family protein [Geobacteraceae bacterium]
MANKEEQGKEKKAAEEVPKSGKKKWIIIGVIALVVAVGAAAGVFFYMRSNGEGEGAEASAGKKEAAVRKTPVIYPLEPFIVNIHDGANLRYLKVKLEFEITAAEAKEELDKIQAPMRDAILVLLSNKNLDDITMTDGKNKLRDEVMATVARVAPAGKVVRVYFTDFVVQ